MNEKIIEEYCEKKAQEIVGIFLHTHEPSDFEIDPQPIEKEIYEVSKSYARIFLFENHSLPLQEGRQNIKQQLLSSFDIEEKQLDKMSDVDLIGHLIKLSVVRQLEDRGISLI